MEALFPLAAPGEVAGPWDHIEQRERGTLATLSIGFTAALAAINREGLRRRAERPKDYAYQLEAETRLAGPWLGATTWLAGMQLAGVRDRLLYICASARVAEDRGQRLYCWSGPGFNPYVLVTGSDEALPEYLASKRRGKIT